jgi:hypothetical protein
MALLVCAEAPEQRLHQHRVVSKQSPAQEPGAENELVPSLVEGLRTPDDWYKRARPQILTRWKTILGKLEPAPADKRWFADPRKAVIHRKNEMEDTRASRSICRSKAISCSSIYCLCPRAKVRSRP